MRIFLSVGEPSGDVHGANLVRELRTLDPNIECVGFGGPRMQQSGCQLIADLTKLAVMFIWSVIKNYRTFKRYLNQADTYFRNNCVDAVVLIDYPGFNWLVARRAKKYGIPVFYYGVPQMWAWAPWRVKKLKRLVDHVLCKLPFEPDWFRDRGVKAEFVGHPFYDELANQKLDRQFCSQMREKAEKILLLLPGSRDSEVARNWPILRDAAHHVSQQVPGVAVVVGAFCDEHKAAIERQLSDEGHALQVFVGRTPELMSVADCAIACSGSVSLELMYHKLPTVIVYRVSRLKFFVQHFLIRARFITLVNLMASESIERTGRTAYDPDAVGAETVPMPEYLTSHDCAVSVGQRISRWLTADEERLASRNWLSQLKDRFAHPGATGRAGRLILDTLKSGQQTPDELERRSRQVA
ncbi:MAG: lipid-A-disaccharide synthase [Pirellulaceae bacterium]